MGTTFSAEVSETRELASLFLDAFSHEYEKLYKWFLLQHVRRAVRYEMESNNNTSLWRLQRAPYVPEQLNKRGEVLAVKQSKRLKRWKPRFFVLRGDYYLDYYDSRNDFLANKKSLGTINVADVTVNCDAAKAVRERSDRLLTAYCVPLTSAVPSEAYPSLTIELYNKRRDPVYIRFPKKDTYEEWCATLDKAHWLTERLKTEDNIHRRAFIEAFCRARIVSGLRDSMEFSSTETTILHDAIMEIVESVVVPKFLSKLSGSSLKDYTTQLNFFYTKAEGLLDVFVAGKWHAVQGANCTHRATLEAKMRDDIEVINAFEMPFREEVMKNMSEEVMSFILKRIEEPLKKLLALVTPTVFSVFNDLPDVYETCALQGKVRYEPESGYMYLAKHYNSLGACYEVEDKLWRLRESIASLKAEFNGRIFDAFVIYEAALCPLRRIIANALFTFERLYERDRKQRAWDDVMREVRGFVKVDSDRMLLEVLVELLFQTAVLFFRDECARPLLKRFDKTLIEPFQERAAEELESFVLSVQEMAADVLDSLLHDKCLEIAKTAINTTL